MPGPENNKLDRLKTALYSRDGFVPDDPITPLSKEAMTVPTAWDKRPPMPDLPLRPHTPFIKIAIWFAVVFFVFAVGIAGWLFYTGYNTVSTGNVDIVLSGPTTVAGGQPLALGVTIQNHNTVDLQNTFLIVTYPEGARKTIDTTDPLLRERIPIGALASGAATSKTIEAVFYGIKDSQERISVSVQYTVAESQGNFEKATDYIFTLGPAPVDVVVSYPTEIGSGQTVTVGVDISSNTTIPLSNIMLKMDYPAGFTFATSTPAADIDNNVWAINTLAPGQKKHITIMGALEGPENETRAFRYSIGNPDPNNRRNVATVFITDTKQVTLRKPFIGLNLALGDSTTDPTFVQSGSTISANLTFINNLIDQLTNAVVEVQITGAYLDKSLIQPGQGFYQSATNILSWDQRQISALGSIDPNDRGSLQFTFGTIPFSKSRTAQVNQPITIKVTARGTRNSTTAGPQQVSSTIIRQVKFLSQADFDGAVVSSIGPFTNYGPIPPKAEKETTYTVIWTVHNTYNPLSGGQVKATLPSYVKFLSSSPSTESLTYNSASGDVTWNIGNIAANTGYGSLPKQVAFQISIVPSKTQINNAPELIGASLFTAQDTVTNQPVRSAEVPLTIQMPTDPSYKPGQGVVVP